MRYKGDIGEPWNMSQTLLLFSNHTVSIELEYSVNDLKVQNTRPICVSDIFLI